MPQTHSLPLTETQHLDLKAYRQRLLLLGLLSAGIDVAAFYLQAPLIIVSFGSSLIVDEMIEWVISSLIAKNKIRLKKRYKFAGLIPVPGITSLSLQAIAEMIASYRNPQKVLARLAAPE